MRTWTIDEYAGGMALDICVDGQPVARASDSGWTWPEDFDVEGTVQFIVDACNAAEQRTEFHDDVRAFIDRSRARLNAMPWNEDDSPEEQRLRSLTDTHKT